MENPRIRFVDVVPIQQEGQQMYLLRDPEGISERSLVVSRDVLFVLSLMDGARSVKDLQEEYSRAFGNLIPIEQIQSIIDGMDNNLLLHNERYQLHLSGLMEAYASQTCRPSFLAGKSFPAEEEELRTVVSGFMGSQDGVEAPGRISGILAPHIDYMRGKQVYADAYRYLPHTEHDLIVIFGTCHGFTPGLWNISLKDFSTPLGTVKSAGGLSALIMANNVLSKSIFEWPHRNEHSIELQLPIIQFLVGDRDIEILPILNGSMHQFISGERKIDDDELADLSGNLKEVLEQYGKSYLVIAAADLAHIGAQFGDQFQLDSAILDYSKTSDQLILEQIMKTDARGFFEAVKDEGDTRRICGLAPIFFQLSMLKSSKAELTGYDQWTDGASSVSFAGAVFYE
jgi:MEMO1 family protein